MKLGREAKRRPLQVALDYARARVHVTEIERIAWWSELLDRSGLHTGEGRGFNPVGAPLALKRPSAA